jgi:uncharacterized membrane protein (UPF0136 family)
MRWLDNLVLVYGIFLIAMGIYGFIGAHSVVSLIAGSVSGIIEIGFALVTPKNPRLGRIGASVVALLMLGKFAPEVHSGGKPDLMAIAAFSLVVFACLLGGHFYAMNRRKARESSQP